jgi:hypothetical protein
MRESDRRLRLQIADLERCREHVGGLRKRAGLRAPRDVYLVRFGRRPPLDEHNSVGVVLIEANDEFLAPIVRSRVADSRPETCEIGLHQAGLYLEFRHNEDRHRRRVPGSYVCRPRKTDYQPPAYRARKAGFDIPLNAGLCRARRGSSRVFTAQRISRPDVATKA